MPSGRVVSLPVNSQTSITAVYSVAYAVLHPKLYADANKLETGQQLRHEPDPMRQPQPFVSPDPSAAAFPGARERLQLALTLTDRTNARICSGKVTTATVARPRLTACAGVRRSCTCCCGT